MARLRTALAGLCGCAVMAGLLVWIGGEDVLGIMRDAGWLLVPLAAGHVVSLTLDASAWRALAPPPRASVAAYLLARWVREAVNALLPAAQIGGEVAAVRLLARSDGRVGWHASIVTLDLVAEFVSMTALGLGGAVVLVAEVAPQLRPQALTVGAAMLPPAALALAFAVAQRSGLARRLATRLDGRWPRLAAALREAETATSLAWARPGAILSAIALHALGWVCGAVETWATLAAFGHHLSPLLAFALEATSEVLRSFGFAVPGMMAVQEGSLILVGGLVGVAPAEAVALSLFRRARDVAVGLPALLA